MGFNTTDTGSHAFGGSEGHRIRTLDGTSAKERTFTFSGTATDGVYSLQLLKNGVSVGTATVTRSTTPATNDDLATAMRSAWDAVAALAALTGAAGGSGADVEITFDGDGEDYTIVAVDPDPGVLSQTAATHLLGTNSDRYLLVDPSSMPIGVDLPPVAKSHNGKSGLIFSLKSIADDNAVTIDGNGSETIDGATTFTLDGEDASVDIVCDGDEWHTYGVERPHSVRAASDTDVTIEAGDDIIQLTTTSGGSGNTVSNGSMIPGKLYTVVMVAHDTNDYTATVVASGGTTLTFNAANETAVLVFDGTSLRVVSLLGATVA